MFSSNFPTVPNGGAPAMPLTPGASGNGGATPFSAAPQTWSPPEPQAYGDLPQPLPVGAPKFQLQQPSLPRPVGISLQQLPGRASPFQSQQSPHPPPVGMSLQQLPGGASPFQLQQTPHPPPVGMSLQQLPGGAPPFQSQQLPHPPPVGMSLQQLPGGAPPFQSQQLPHPPPVDMSLQQLPGGAPPFQSQQLPHPPPVGISLQQLPGGASPFQLQQTPVSPPLGMTTQQSFGQPDGMAGWVGALGSENSEGMHGQQVRYLDLLSERQLTTRYEMADEELQIPNSVCNPYVHCAPSIMRCTMLAMPETTELLNKCRLPLGLTLQPFRDLKNLTIIQTTIVRCRYCRTYINPYVYISDNRHWKCNLCYRLNDLPEEFSWDPMSKSFGDPTRRPEIQNATIEYVAPNEYMLRDPQPAMYFFILDVSANAVDSGYLHVFAEQLTATLDHLPGDDRTMVGFMGIDAALHFFQFTDVDVMPKHLIVSDVHDPFFPVNCGLFAELKYFRETIAAFVQNLPTLFESNSSDGCCFGAALQIARDLIFDIGGRVSAFLTTPVNVGPGAMNTALENPAKKATKANLLPSTDFYKSVALECTGKQIAIDLFVLGERYVDLATLADASKYSAGSVYHFPAFHLIRNSVEVMRFKRTLHRYFTRKIGFEAVLRIRCSKGVSMHTFHGNFFVRSTDLLALANVNPDAAMGIQVQIDESLAGQQSICFQSALLYTSSKGDRRIRVHTLCIPVERDMGKIFHYFDAKAAVSLLAKMAAERAMSGAELTDCREALTNAACDALTAYNRSVGMRPSAVLAPIEGHLKFLPQLVLGLLKNRALSGSLASGAMSADERMSMMLLFKNAPSEKILLTIYPALYPVHGLEQSNEVPPRLPLSYEHVSREGVYLLDAGTVVYLFVCHSADGAVLEKIFGVNAFAKIDEEATLELLSNPLSEKLHEFIRYRFENRAKSFAPVVILREDGPNRHLFTSRLIEDRTESSHSYVEFLQVLKREIHSN